MTTLLDQISNQIPSGIREVLLGNSRQDLLNRVTDTLVLFGDELLHAESERSHRIALDSLALLNVEPFKSAIQPKNPPCNQSVQPDNNWPSGQSAEVASAVPSAGLAEAPAQAPDGDRPVTDGEVHAAAVAEAAKQLLAGADSECSILLLLAPSEFLVTEQHMPGLSGANLISAITLQQTTILPACDEALALAVSDRGTDDNRLALWIRQARLTALFDAFASQGLALAALAPRTLALTESAQAVLLLDDDGHDTTFISAEGAVLERWVQIRNAELAESAFAAQWQEQLAAFEAEAKRTLTAAQDFAVGRRIEVEPAYGFFPLGALASSRRRTQRRQLKITAALLVGLLGLAASPFLAQSFELQKTKAQLEFNRQLSVEARQDQAVVVQYENRWGAINEFPQQDVAAAMFGLQEVLAGEQLSSLELSEGLIRIQGTSSDPQAILQQLEQDPLFTEVVFSRATNNTRYYIDLRLATVNFEAYRVRHFPDET